jgi:hypothetical protein
MVIAKKLPSSGLWCDRCNRKRLEGQKPSTAATRSRGMVKSALGALIKEVDHAYSEHQRQAGADEEGNVSCLTCPRRSHWKKMHLGHYVERGTFEIRWEESNTGPQCPRCNIEGKGMPKEFAKAIDAMHGAGTAQALKAMKYKTVKIDRQRLQELLKKYTV